jgi:2-keto-4-pentenoate hydratase/2-oxohepta-3-ene-1,7-dioic acid hydratase in catechol pathway
MRKYGSPVLIVLIFVSNISFSQESITKYVRYIHQGEESSGVLNGETIQELRGDLFSPIIFTGSNVALSDVKLLPPCNPSKVLAVGLNYKSHLGDRPVPDHMGLFSKFPTCIIAHEEPIQMPPDASNLHYEGELVIVIGKEANKITVDQASQYIFGVTAGNDVSERDWQRSDLQWLRAKASDTFGPIGPAIVTGLSYNDLLLETRLNGEVVQSERTKDLIYSVEEIVSYISQYVTLFPGDIIFTGTPGSTSAMEPGDIVEVELEGVGVLRNRVQKID